MGADQTPRHEWKRWAIEFSWKCLCHHQAIEIPRPGRNQAAL
jgi:hypothetical protein